MKELALVILLASVAFAHPQQVSSGNNSPNIQHVKGGVTITYTIVQSPCTIPSATSGNYAGGIVDYQSPLFREVGAAGLPFAPLGRPSIPDASVSSLSSTFGISPGFTAGGLLINTASGGKPLLWWGDSSATPAGFLSSGSTDPLSLSSRAPGSSDPLRVITVTASIDYTFPQSKTMVDSTAVKSLSDAYVDGSVLSTLTGSATFGWSSIPNTLVGSGATIGGTDSISPLKNVAVIAGNVDGSVLAGTLTGSATFGWSSIPSTLAGSGATSADTDSMSPFKNVAVIAGNVYGSVLANTLTGSATFGWRSIPNTLVGSALTVTGTDSMSPFKNVTEIAGNVYGSVLASTLAGSATLDGSSIPSTLLGSSSTITGTDYPSLSKSLADLTTRGNIITGWSLTYLPGGAR